LPELDNPGLARVLLIIGLIGTVVELASSLFLPRLLLFVLVLGAGALGLVRRRTPHAAMTTAV
jgi:hypothetical protein